VLPQGEWGVAAEKASTRKALGRRGHWRWPGPLAPEPITKPHQLSQQTLKSGPHLLSLKARPRSSAQCPLQPSPYSFNLRGSQPFPRRHFLVRTSDDRPSPASSLFQGWWNPETSFAEVIAQSRASAGARPFWRPGIAGGCASGLHPHDHAPPPLISNNSNPAPSTFRAHAASHRRCGRNFDRRVVPSPGAPLQAELVHRHPLAQAAGRGPPAPRAFRWRQPPRLSLSSSAASTAGCRRSELLAI